MVNGEFRTFFQYIQLLIGDNRRNFEDGIGTRIQARHLQIDPDQIVFVRQCVAHAANCPDLLSVP